MALHLCRAFALAAAFHASCAYADGVDVEAIFGPYMSSGTEIAEASDANFSSVVTHRWSEWRKPEWTGAIKPKTEHHLQEIVRLASAHNIPFMATNGGHGTSLVYGTFKGLDINLDNFNTLEIDLEKNYLIVGAGTKIGGITEPLYKAGKAVPRGNSPCVGMIGATIGGGIGFETGLFGLGIDALESVRLVTSTGHIVTASAGCNPQLFWAIKGAGANFGIITQAKFTLADQPNKGNAVIGSFIFPEEHALAVFAELQSLDNILPADLGVQLSLSYNHTTNASQVLVDMKHFGPWETFLPHWATAKRLGYTSAVIKNVTLVELYAGLDGPCKTGAYVSGGTTGLGRTDPGTMMEVLKEISDFSVANPGYQGQTLFQRYANNKTLETPLSSAVYPWRDTKTFWLHENIYEDPALEQPSIDLLISLRKKLQATSGFDEPHIYINYAFGDEGQAAWWSAANLAKLRKVKARWDPKNLFGRGTPIN